MEQKCSAMEQKRSSGEDVLPAHRFVPVGSTGRRPLKVQIAELEATQTELRKTVAAQAKSIAALEQERAAADDGHAGEVAALRDRIEIAVSELSRRLEKRMQLQAAENLRLLNQVKSLKASGEAQRQRSRELDRSIEELQEELGDA